MIGEKSAIARNQSPFSPCNAFLPSVLPSLPLFLFAGELLRFSPALGLPLDSRPLRALETPRLSLSRAPLQLSAPMASDQQAANALKLQGNKAFAEHEWPAAVEFYTQAIEKYDKEPSFFSNRAQVRRLPTRPSLRGKIGPGLEFANVPSWQAQIKLEAFGFAVADATKALELDPNYVKVSRYREGYPRTQKDAHCMQMEG